MYKNGTSSLFSITVNALLVVWCMPVGCHCTTVANTDEII